MFKPKKNKSLVDLNRGRHSSSDLDSADSFMIVKRQLSKSYRENYLSSDGDIKGANRSPSISSSSPMSTDQEERARPVNMSSIESGLEKIGFLESPTDKVVQTSRESLPLQNPFSLKRKLPATGTDGTALQEGREVSQVDLDCDNPEAKKKKISLHNYQLRTSHKEFVKNFVRKFEDTLKGCYDQIGKVKKVKLPTLLSEKSSKMGLIGGSVATGVAAGAGLLTVSVPAVIAIAAAAVTAGNCVDYAATKTARFFCTRKATKKAAKVANAGYNPAVDHAQIRKVLVKAGVDIFLHYKHQYMNVKYEKVPGLTMEFLAQNAVGRVINYLQSLKDGMQEEDPERFLENFHTLITKGIVLGNSDKVKLLFIFKDTKEKFNVEAMYAQVGLVRVTDGNGANEYYTKGGATDVEKYGYRAMFEWELENVQKDIWEKEKNSPKIQYEYTLKPEKIEENVKQILKEINEGDKVLKRDIVDLKSICKDNNRLLSIQQTGLELGKFTIALDLILRSAIEDNKLEEVEYLLGLYKKYFNYKIENSNKGYNSLQSSAQCDSIKLFKHLIEKESYDYKIEFDDEEGYNLLQLAAENDSIRVFEYLTGIEWFSCKIKDDRKYNLLGICAKNDSIQVLEYLIGTRNYSHEIENEKRYDLLLITAKYDSVRILRYLKGKGFSHEIENDGGYNLFSTAVKYNSINLVMHLMEERYCESQIKNDGGYNLLQLAVKHDSAEVLGYLKRRGFSYEIENDGGYNLLQLAVKHDSRRVVECLRKDNSFNYPKVKCYGLFCRAVRYGAIKVSEYLISNEDYKIAHNIVYDLFKLACDKDHLEDFKFLLDEEKVDINAVNIQGVTLLHLAAKQGHIGLVKFLVSNGANISIRDRLGKAPREVAMSEEQVFLGKEQTFYNQGLFYALSKKNLTTIIKLLSYGADINAQDNHGKTLLHLAAMEGCFNTVELLVERGANISIQDSSGKTPREVAVGKVSEFLDDTKIHHNERLFRALSKKDLNTIKKMLDWGADINAQEDKGYTPLHLVAEKGHLDLIELLVERGANINAKDREEEKTLLHYAVINNKINLLKKLADIEGIDANLTDSKGFSPLYYAAKDCNIDALKELKKFKSINDRCPSNDSISGYDLMAFCCAIDHSKKLKFDKRTTDFLEELIDVEGVEINVQDQDGKTLLHYAVINNKINLLKKLADIEGIDANLTDSKGFSPLYYAAKDCNIDALKELKKFKSINDRCPSNNFISSHDLTAFCCAIDHSKKLKFDKRTTDFLEELIDVEGVEINVQDQDGKTLLHYVAKTTSYCLVQKLLDMQNINLNIEDNKGMTPMHYAILEYQLHVVKKLAKARNINCDFLGDKGKKFLHRIVEFNQSDLLSELVKIINEKTKSNASVMKGVKISPIQHQMTHWV